MQDYKSLRAAIVICAALVNIQTHIHTDSIFNQFIAKAQPAELKLASITLKQMSDYCCGHCTNYTFSYCML